MSRITRIIIDEQEFLDIIRGKIRKELRKYLGRGRIRVRRKGENKTIEIPVDEIEIPTFRYGYPSETAIGQGEGKPGDDLGPVQDPDDGNEGGQGGQGHGDRRVIVELPEQDFSHLFQEILELPRIKPKGDRSIFEEREKYTTISTIGPHSLRHLRKTFLQALKRNIATGEFNPPDKSKILIWPKDFRFRSWQKIREPKNNAVIFYMRDVSGSMGPREREIVSRLCDLCDFWLSWNYDKLETVYVIHDDQPERVSREEFFTIDFGGGTSCSTAQQMASDIIDVEFPPSKWNIYIIYLSDGMNWTQDNEKFVEILRDKLLPIVNQYNYGQIQLERPWWDAYGQSGAKVFAPPGTIGRLIQDNFEDKENIAQTVIGSEDEEVIIDAIKKFFGKGN
jgi:uncharacterized sporulation protein YeaH/YhbH (DUF444 family)